MRIIESTMEKTQQQLLPFAEALDSMRKMYGRSQQVLDVSTLLGGVHREREKMLMAVSVELLYPNTARFQ